MNKKIFPGRNAKTKRVTVTNKQTDRHTVRRTDCDRKILHFENTYHLFQHKVLENINNDFILNVKIQFQITHFY
jgi:hypothetical protein